MRDRWRNGAAPGRRVQLHRAMSKLGWGSRGEGRLWISEGRVRVNGRVCTDPFTWIDLAVDDVTLDGRAPAPASHRLISIHKPVGIVVTHRDERGRPDVFSLLPRGLPRLVAIGRLDADSEGLLLLTTSGTLADTLTDPARHVPKRYWLTVKGRVGPEVIAALASGLVLDDGPTRPAAARLLEAGDRFSLLELVLTEGRNRQARRMLQSVGHPVERLVRMAIGDLELGDLAPGQWREENFSRFGVADQG